MAEKVLEAHSLTYTPPGGKTPLYKDFSFALNKGEFLLLAGSNGCGKSTLFKLLTGFLSPEKGRISLLGKDLSLWKERERSRILGYIPQLLPSSGALTIRELVTSGLSGGTFSGLFLPKKEKAKVENAIESMELAPLAERRLTALSGGELKRAAIAAILVREPAILLLDEPTASLDFFHGEKLMYLLEKERKERGVTIAMASHDLLLPPPFATRVLLMTKGAVAAEGTPEETLTKENLQKTFQCHLEVGRSSTGVLTFSLEK